MYILSKIGFRIFLFFIDTTERLQKIFRVIVLTFEILQYVFSWKNQIAIYLFEQLPNAILEKNSKYVSIIYYVELFRNSEFL